MANTAPNNIPKQPYQAIALIRLFFIRFSLGLFGVLSIVIIILGQMDNRFAELVRMRTVDGLLPIMNIMAWPSDAIISLKEKITTFSTLSHENALLRQKNNMLLQHYTLSQHIKTENEELRKLLHISKEPQVSFVTARVVGDVKSPYVRSILINAGQHDGIRKNQVVMNEQGMVGRIIETGQKTARILLLTDFNSKVPIVTSESRERGIAAGDNSEIIKILYLPGSTKIKIGEQVFTSGDGDMLPSNLLVGTIYAKTDQGFYIKPAVEWNRLGYVQVVGSGE